MPEQNDEYLALTLGHLMNILTQSRACAVECWSVMFWALLDGETGRHSAKKRGSRMSRVYFRASATLLLSIRLLLPTVGSSQIAPQRDASINLVTPEQKTRGNKARTQLIQISVEERGSGLELQVHISKAALALARS